jgi:ATP-dependent RNA helicase RhlE
MPEFTSLGLAPSILTALEKLKLTVPTPIQEKAIPIAVAGNDVIGIAQTGTGKTFAFSLPMIQRISKIKKMGLVILPTRELALQVEESIQKIGRQFGLRTAVVIGGSSMYHQVQAIRKNPHIIIGTPGRIIDHLQQKSIDLNRVGILVLDEADRMLDMGFAPQIKQILQHVPKERQTMLFSATMPQEIVQIASKYMKTPVRVEVARQGSVASQVDQELFIVPKSEKERLLDKLLDEYKGTVLVFSRTKYGAKKICRAIRHMGHTSAEIHSNLSLSQRKRSLAGFKSGDFRVLVATDIAARGIDVTNIELVINYDLPENPDDYVHRVGRTGRAGKIGKAISFVATDQRHKVRSIERLVQTPLSISPLPQLPPARMYRGHDSYVAKDTRVSPSHRRTTFQYAHKNKRTSKHRPYGSAHKRPSRAGGAPRIHL